MNDIILLLILQLVYVPMLALRTISMVKKLRVLTAFFGFLESIVYVFGLAIVFTGEQSMVEMLVYAIGFSLGLIVGIEIERKIAIGYISFLVNINNKNEKLIHALRENGYGVTVFSGEGRDSTRYRLDILTRRNQEKQLMAIIEQYEPNSFVLAYEPTRFKGGFMEVMMKHQIRLSRHHKTKDKAMKQENEASWLKKTAESLVNEVNELVVKEDDDLPPY